jgi:integrase
LLRTPIVKPPAYRKRRIRGRDIAVVTLRDASTGQRRDVWLGAYGTPQSREAYAREITAWTAAGHRLEPMTEPQRRRSPRLTVSHLIHHYWFRHVRGAYSSGETGSIQLALRVLRALYGSSPADAFGPNALRLVRQAMVDGDPQANPPRAPWSRPYINKQMHRVKALFRWGVSHELLPVSVAQSLATVEPLRRGRTTAREAGKVLPVPQAHIDAVRPHVGRHVRAMIDLQVLTGMRPGELCVMRAIDIDRSGPVWLYTPIEHKTQHLGKSRTIYLGPRAQEIIAQFLTSPLDAYLFSPAESEHERHLQMRAHRTAHPTTNRTRDALRRAAPRSRVRDQYDRDSYRRAIARGCQKAGVPSWHPHQLRHNYATEIRRRFGIEAAQILLGHSSAIVTEVYAERDAAKAVEIARQTG